MDKLWYNGPVGYYSGKKKKWTAVICNIELNLKNTVLSGRIQALDNFINSQKGKTSWQKANYQCPGTKGGGKIDCWRVWGDFFWVTEMFFILIVVVIMQMYTPSRLIGLHAKKDTHIIYKFYLSKVDLNKSLEECPLQPNLRTAGLQLLKAHLCPFSLGQHWAQCHRLKSTFCGNRSLLLFFIFGNSIIEV